MTAATCGNCHAPLFGPYCAQCGQHAHESARSIGALVHEAWHVVTHVDGRFWSTMLALLTAPGRLTAEYFADRRARYAPPVRLYLVLSLLFFAVASATSFLKDRPAAEVGAKPAGAGAAGKPAADAGRTAAATDAAMRQVAQAWQRDLATGGAGREAPPTEAQALAASALAAAGSAPAASPAPSSATPDEDEDSDGDRKSAGAPRPSAGTKTKEVWSGSFGKRFQASDCDAAKSDLPWLEHALRSACRRQAAEGRTLGDVLHAFAANIPKMMFVFLPLIALLMRLLYWSPRRYYVEHLVFVLHNHAALFLAMTLQLLLSALGEIVPAVHRIVPFTGMALFFYAIWYVYRATRRYYGQGRALTLAKLAIVGLGYAAFLVVTLLGTLFVTALTA